MALNRLIGHSAEGKSFFLALHLLNVGFKRGFERIIEGLEVPVIPVHLDRLWGSIFSFQGGRFFWKWPKQLPYPVTVSFAAPLPATATAPQVRQVVMELGNAAMAYRPRATTPRSWRNQV